jgi:hypothetical protein
VDPPCSAEKNLLDLEEKILLKILEFVHPMELHQSVALVRVFFKFHYGVDSQNFLTSTVSINEFHFPMNKPVP